MVTLAIFFYVKFGQRLSAKLFFHPLNEYLTNKSTFPDISHSQSCSNLLLARYRANQHKFPQPKLFVSSKVKVIAENHYAELRKHLLIDIFH